MTTELVTLWGDEHAVLDHVAHAGLDDHSAVALTPGRFPKAYASVDPNEDAVLAARGPAGRLLAVVDGHFGFDAARAALRTVADRAADLVGDDAPRPDKGLQGVCRAARAAVAAAVEGAEAPRAGSRTALTVALLTGDHLHVVTYGDTACVRARGGRATVVDTPAPFLGPDVGIAKVARVRVRARDRVVVASDGLTTYLGRDWAARTAGVLAAAEQPHQAARDLVELAMAGGAGDHIAVAVAL